MESDCCLFRVISPSPPYHIHVKASCRQQSPVYIASQRYIYSTPLSHYELVVMNHQCPAGSEQFPFAIGSRVNPNLMSTKTLDNIIVTT